MGGFTDGRYHLVGFIREKGGFADRRIPESRIYQSRTQQPEILQSRNPIPRAYLIPYFFRIFTTGFLIDSAQRV